LKIAQDQYNAAFSLLRQARYEDAEQALRGFVQHYPKDSLAPAAQYWLGETFYVRKDYASAAATFASSAYACLRFSGSYCLARLRRLDFRSKGTDLR